MTCSSANLVAILCVGRFILITLTLSCANVFPSERNILVILLYYSFNIGNVQIIQLLIYTILFAYTYV